MKRALRSALRAALAAALLVPTAVLAQNGTVSGTVTEAGTSNPISGATVLVIQNQQHTTTDSAGAYSANMPAGDYLLLVAASGYQALEQMVTVEAGETVTADFALNTSLSQFGDTLVVVGSRSARTAIETPVPVDVLSTEDLEETGMSETARMIQFLAPSFNYSTSTISDGTDIVRPSTLRGLGPDQTLVLVNGKRDPGVGAAGR